jgi:hypothetical protein
MFVMSVLLDDTTFPVKTAGEAAAEVRTGVCGRLPAVGASGMYTEKGVEGRNVGVGTVAVTVAAAVVAAGMLVVEITSSAKLLVALAVAVDFAGCIVDVDKLNSLNPVEC